MRAGGDLWAHKGVLRLKDEGKEPGERVAADVVVAIAGGGRKVARGHAVLLKGAHHAARVEALDLVHARKGHLAIRFGAGDQRRNRCGDVGS